MKTKVAVLAIVVFAPLFSYGQQLEVFPSHFTDTLALQQMVQPTTTSFWDKEAVKISFLPTLFFGATAATWNSREDIREQCTSLT